ncbi:MAG: hypothetical protein M3552_12270 [Planctomycetota bacterium]|nr:hypothetical protein [Planctomycetaceae bacterium]MDQ3331409.1 hypothetical protein [Planctomycetota bacterium]
MASFFVEWTVRIASAFYAARILADAADVGSHRLRRALWTIGFGFFALHVAAAFHFVHGWSHTAAWNATARQTAELTGWNSGAGLLANYLFTLVWFADVAAWWCVGSLYPRRLRRTSIVVQIAFAFLWFNATAVFGPPFWRPVVAAFGLLLSATWVWRVRRERGER